MISDVAAWQQVANTWSFSLGKRDFHPDSPDVQIKVFHSFANGLKAVFASFFYLQFPAERRCSRTMLFRKTQNEAKAMVRTRREGVNFKYDFKDRVSLCRLGLSMQLWAHLESGASSWELFWFFFAFQLQDRNAIIPSAGQESHQLSHELAPINTHFSLFLCSFIFAPVSPLTVPFPTKLFFFFPSFSFALLHCDLAQSTWWFGFHIFFWKSFFSLFKKKTTLKLCKHAAKAWSCLF